MTSEINILSLFRNSAGQFAKFRDSPRYPTY